MRAIGTTGSFPTFGPDTDAAIARLDTPTPAPARRPRDACTERSVVREGMQSARTAGPPEPPQPTVPGTRRMKSLHVPVVDGSYWLAITLASVSGTNLGDLYAHESGLGIAAGLTLLALLAAIVFLAERRDQSPRLVYYWLAILIIRTGATNIADYLAFRVRVPQALLAGGLIAIIAIGAALSRRRDPGGEATSRPPSTNGFYWLAMLGAGVFGTVVGDVCSHTVGEGYAAIGLTAVLLAVLFAGRRRWTAVAVYWSALAVARTAGTAVGDWLAESRALHLGLPVATVLTTLTFVAVAVLRQHRRGDRALARNPAAR